jgi:uncharacterized YkwD family protein/spore coat assembly protein SafA
MKKLLSLILATSLLLPAAVGHAQNYDTYTVKRGDSLWKIAVKYQIGITEIINANRQFKNPNLIYPGDKVNVPNIDQTKNVEIQVLDLTNKARAANGLKPLKMDWELQRVARYKSKEMRDKGYFSHTSPTYGSPFQMMKAFKIQYRSAGENIAAGQQTPQQVVDAWLKSPGHRKNIMGNYEYIGVGYAKGGSQRHYWTQQFITK